MICEASEHLPVLNDNPGRYSGTVTRKSQNFHNVGAVLHQFLALISLSKSGAVLVCHVFLH